MYIPIATPTWRTLLRHWVIFECSLARPNAGNNSPARIAMMAMTTSNSMSVNADSGAETLRREPIEVPSHIEAALLRRNVRLSSDAVSVEHLSSPSSSIEIAPIADHSLAPDG